MKRISDRAPVSANTSVVANYINLQLEAIRSHKNQAQVADEAGLPQRNLLSMIRSGQTKVPFERIKGLAKALEVNQNHLFRIALAEYQPRIKELLDEAGRQTISANELRLLSIWRTATDDLDPPVEPVESEVLAAAQHARGFSLEAALTKRVAT